MRLPNWVRFDVGIALGAPPKKNSSFQYDVFMSPTIHLNITALGGVFACTCGWRGVSVDFNDLRLGGKDPYTIHRIAEAMHPMSRDYMEFSAYRRKYAKTTDSDKH